MAGSGPGPGKGWKAFGKRVGGYASDGALRADSLSGLTVAVMGIPQAMAYAALIPGFPPVYGLYTAIVTCLIGALFGSSNHLVTGPTNATCMVLASVAMPFVDQGNTIEVVFLITFLAGVVKLAFGLLRLGGVVRYVSNSVVVGFTAGAGLLIAVNQIKNVLGVELEGSPQLLYEVLVDSLSLLPETNPVALGLALFTVAVMLGAKRIDRRIPGPLLAVSLSALGVWAFGWHEGAGAVRIVRDLSPEPISNSLAIFHFPELLRPTNWAEGFRTGREVISGALAVGIIGLVEVASSTRAVAASSGQRVRFSREFTAQGLSNIGGAFFQCCAGSSSFTRTALCHQSGGVTRMAPAFSALFTALAVLLLAPFANYIPMASLGGMLILIAYSIVEKHRLHLALKAGMNSRWVLLASFASTLILPLHYAIFIGVMVSIVFLLKITGQAELTLLVPRANGRFDEVPPAEAVDEPVVVVNLEGDLYFAAVENLDDELEKITSERTQVVILRMKRLRAVGSTAIAVLEKFLRQLREQDIALVVSGLGRDLSGLVQRSGFGRDIGEQNIFYADNTLFQSTELALARARSIIEMRRKREAEPSEVRPDGEPLLPRAEAMAVRQVIRFGEGHTLREAVWLLSEMHKRMREDETQPLFLQDKEGRLAGKASAWRMLAEMTRDIPPEDMQRLDDEALGRRMAVAFPRVLRDMARRDLPQLDHDTPMGALLLHGVARDLRVLPIRDGQGRVVGLVRQRDLLLGLGPVLGFHEEDPDTLFGG